MDNITTKLANALIGVLETEKAGGYSGCGFCDSGRLRKPTTPERAKDYDHQYDCPYKIANDVVAESASLPSVDKEAGEIERRDKTIAAMDVMYNDCVSEIERLKGLISQAWQQSIINCEVENGAGDAGEVFVSWQQFKTENNL